ncbi:uncharacterized protein ColSpa_05237 [Colletotrichum spaethianum]|uniref:Uncharacterized protein n=1 Tax=Colletotrichum spaethianum TaxID=700344 RepID=A0AA37LAH5_9PEZI|nr:uncharacterized protein ColSpa_05237 [Colletotrichum spaethianum]GKT45056.1 hypothetical protein ColSpa_05237 [Colletotrichum spaethianum]
MSLAEATPLSAGQAAVNPSVAAHVGVDRLGGDATPRASSHHNSETESSKKDVKNKVRGLFGLGKKKEDPNVSKSSSTTPASTATSNPSLSRDASRASARSTPYIGDHSHVHPSSPGRGMSSSPRVPSPAGSQIFERDVDNMSMKPQSPAIPSHIQTENHIPPVLDASSEAITDNHLDPDSVEIVTHAHHQPAAAAVTGANGTPHTADSMSASWTDELRAFADRDDASNVNSLDNADVRRLSFISFADVVQAEHGGHGGTAGSRDSIHVAGLTSLSSINARSPSPIRSPVSSQGPGTSPPTSNPASVKGLEMSPGRKSLGSPISSHHNLNMSGELNIETMSQALRRTGSTDLSGVRSFPTSPIEGPSR